MSRKSLVGIFGFTAMMFVTGVSFYLSQQQVLTRQKVVNTKASETTQTTANNREIIISMGNMQDLPIAAPDLGFPATPENSACTDSNASQEWVLGQHFNDYSVCPSEKLSAAQSCPQASLARSSQTARLCYWGDQKRSELAINTENMLYKGCYISRTDARKQFAGGYSMYHTWDSAQNSYANTPFMYANNLEKIVISTQYSTDYYLNRGKCMPEDYPAGVQGDPVFAESRVDGNGDGDNTDKEDTAIGTVNAAFSYISFNIHSPDNKTHIFYQVGLYDNRPEMLKPESRYISCNFAPGTSINNFIVVTEPVSIFGQPFAMPGSGRKSYSIDFMPKIKEWVRYCNPNQPVDLSNLVVGKVSIGNELIGKHIMTNTVVDPKIQLVLKEGVVNSSISSVNPSPLLGTQIMSFAKVTASKTTGTDTADKVVDGNEQTYWHSGDSTPQWVDFELAGPSPVSGVQLKAGISPNGYRRYRILGGNNPDPSTWQTLGEVHGMTTTAEWITIPVIVPQAVKYLRLQAVEGVSHVMLFEVKVFQAVPTPTTVVPTPTTTPTRIPTPSLTPTSQTAQELLISKGAQVTASRTFSTNIPDKVVDADMNTAWNAGGGAPQWIELNVGQRRTISSIKLIANQSPAGQTVHRIYAGAFPNPTTLVKEFNGITQYGQNLIASFTPALTNVQYIRVQTVTSPSWVSWFEIQAFSPAGSPTIAVVPLTPTPIPTSTPTSTTIGQGCPPTYPRKNCTNSTFCRYLGGIVSQEKCDFGYTYCCLR